MQWFGRIKRSLGFASLLLIVTHSSSLYGESASWRKTIDKVTNSIVSIQFEVPRAFETSRPMTSQGTGFVVDAERGIILTNRHIVQPGPVTATAIFKNQEEVELKPIYRDPVHDFGFFQYDPEKLQYLKVTSLTLHPELAQVGMEIRVIGNDAGEKLSILDGTLAKLNREAPNYGPHGFNDFNTFYIQAASGASGGSSGSPVINEQGKVIALQAGGTSVANTNMFFPLDRVQHALEFIRRGEEVVRGTLESTFVYRSYAELRRLGLGHKEESLFREQDPEAQGALVVDKLLPEGPAADLLAPGDILFRIDDSIVSRFIPLEAYLDQQVGKTIQLEFIRGGILMSGEVTVKSLAEITPRRYLEIGRAVLHDLSYQQARNLNRAVKGVVVTSPGHMFGSSGVSAGSVITSINKKPVTDLDDAIAALQEIPDEEEFPVRYYGVRDPHNDSLSIVSNDRHWHAAKLCDYETVSGHWVCQSLPEAPPATEPEIQNAEHPQQQNSIASDIAPSLVWVNFITPYAVDEIGTGHSSGSGLIVDAERGLVVVDRTTVPSIIGDVSLTFAGSVKIPAEVVFIHPLHNMTLLRYKPELLGTTKVQSAALSGLAPRPGDRIHAVGTNYNYEVLVQTRQVSTYGPLQQDTSRKPRFRDANLMVISTDSHYTHSSGVFLNGEAEVVAMIVSYQFNGREPKQKHWAIPAQHINDLLTLYGSGTGSLHSLEVEWGLVSFVAARQLGIPTDWLDRIAAENPDSHQILMVNNTWKGTPAEKHLLSGDLLLSVDGKIVSSFRDIEIAAQKPQLSLTIARDGEVMEIELDTVALSGMGTDRVLLWAGAFLQQPHRALRTEFGLTEPGIYVSRQYLGSPAQHFGIRGLLITAVDESPTPDLESFIEVVRSKSDRDSVRLKVLDTRGRSRLITLKLNNNYWPMAQIIRTEKGWTRQEL